VEVSPKKATAEDLFLTVMQIADRRTGGWFPTRRIDGEGSWGA
jgi:hypothetical protein